jgi:hypothetical protein
MDENEKKMDRDKRSYIIRNILKSIYPNNSFKVRIEKYNFGESIHVYTDLLEDTKFTDAVWRVHANKNPSEEDYLEAKKYYEKQSKNQLIERKIEQILKDFWHVNYDQRTGEILEGGNTYLFIKRLKK